MTYVKVSTQSSVHKWAIVEFSLPMLGQCPCFLPTSQAMYTQDGMVKKSVAILVGIPVLPFVV